MRPTAVVAGVTTAHGPEHGSGIGTVGLERTTSPTDQAGTDGTAGPNGMGTEVVAIVIGLDGWPRPGVWMRLDGADCLTPVRPARLTDASGTVRFDDVVPGRYCLSQVVTDGAGSPGARAGMTVAVGGASTHVVIASPSVDTSPGGMGAGAGGEELAVSAPGDQEGHTVVGSSEPRSGMGGATSTVGPVAPDRVGGDDGESVPSDDAAIGGGDGTGGP